MAPDKKEYRCTDSQGDYTVYCTNMPVTVTMDELNELFSKFGKLIAILPYKPSGKFNGVIFVKYENREMAKSCIQALNNTNYKNKLIALRYVNQKKKRDDKDDRRRHPRDPPPRDSIDDRFDRRPPPPDYDMYDDYPPLPPPPRYIDRGFDPVLEPPIYPRGLGRRLEYDDRGRYDDFPPPPPYPISRYDDFGGLPGPGPDPRAFPPPAPLRYDDLPPQYAGLPPQMRYDDMPPLNQPILPSTGPIQMPSARFADELAQQPLPSNGAITSGNGRGYDDPYAYDTRPLY